MGLLGVFGPPNVDQLKASKNVNGLIRALGYKKDAVVRRDAVIALVDMGAPAVPQLILNLDNGNELIRRSAADILVRIGAPAVTPLINVMQVLQNWNTDECLAMADVLQRVTTGLRDSDKDIRQVATEALSKLSAPEETPLTCADDLAG